jgi:hypothetical protein
MKRPSRTLPPLRLQHLPAMISEVNRVGLPGGAAPKRIVAAHRSDMEMPLTVYNNAGGPGDLRAVSRSSRFVAPITTGCRFATCCFPPCATMGGSPDRRPIVHSCGLGPPGAREDTTSSAVDKSAEKRLTAADPASGRSPRNRNEAAAGTADVRSEAAT